MEDFRNCPSCGKIFVHKSRNLCPACIDLEEKDFEVVRKYLRQHPRARIPEVVEKTAVAEETILNFIKDGRLKADGVRDLLRCEVCGAPISSGVYCEQCLGQLNQQFKVSRPAPAGPLNPDPKKNSKKMYIKE